jgi:hypothetical protein
MPMLIGYSILMLNDLKVIMFFIMAVFGAFMVNSFLQFAATNQFRISYWGIGPTEVRLVFIIINILIIYVNQVVRSSAVTSWTATRPMAGSTSTRNRGFIRTPF